MKSDLTKSIDITNVHEGVLQENSISTLGIMNFLLSIDIVKANRANDNTHLG